MSDPAGGSPEHLPTVTVDVSGLEPGHTRLFPFVREDEELTGFVVNHEGQLYVYVNRCAHVTYSLDIGDGEVMDKEREFILCSVHGARYLPESGHCFLGPAVGRSLEALPFSQEGAEVTVTITAEPTGWPRPATAP